MIGGPGLNMSEQLLKGFLFATQIARRYLSSSLLYILHDSRFGDVRVSLLEEILNTF